MELEQSQITALLQRWSRGDKEALDRLIPILYERLRDLAHNRLRDAPDERSLDTTGLVHEVYLKFANSPSASVENRNHFLAIASRVMRSVLVDHARARAAVKRGSGLAALELKEDVWIDGVDLDAVSDLDEALKKLEMLDPRQSQIVEQRYFGGLSLEETASALALSLATVKRELRTARAWLANELASQSAS
ncbi:MAG TPA: ECF-type sigma factor [Gemmatimonadaceae bacterium]|jgi:RNA polymerase sigma factor (TIGR02999 family)|nr:ECF-type sigma factor [Gemmatimonadaceae bacterium]